MKSKPVALVLGSTGQLGSLVAKKLMESSSIHLRVTSRKKEQLETLASRFGDARYLDLDDGATYEVAFEGVDRLFLLTGYSFSMVLQSKIAIDNAKKAGVKQIVHVGVFSLDPDCTVPHFAWHQMIEAYIRESGLSWTNLHPNCFLQNLLNFSLIKEGKVHWYAKDVPCGWIALEDVAEAAAAILEEGPKHHGKDYWFSSESMTLSQLTRTLSEVTGTLLRAEPLTAEQFLVDSDASQKTLDPYLLSVAESFRQIEAGAMAYIGEVKDDLPKIIGRKGMSVAQWMEKHRDQLTNLAGSSHGSTVWGGKE